MDNQHRKIDGYRELTQDEIDLINTIKSAEAQFNAIIDQMARTVGLDQRCVSLGATHGEDAFSRLVRAVARPERKVA